MFLLLFCTSRSFILDMFYPLPSRSFKNKFAKTQIFPITLPIRFVRVINNLIKIAEGIIWT